MKKLMTALLLVSTSLSFANTEILKVTTKLNTTDNPKNSFKMNKYEQNGVSEKPPVVLLPGSFFNFNSFTLGKENIVNTLIEQGFNVYGISPRTQKLSLMNQHKYTKAAKTWGMDSYVEDAEKVAEIAFEETGKKPILIGYSLGAITAYSMIQNNPEAYSGLVILEGMITSSSKTTAPLKKWCRKFTKAHKRGNTLEHVDGSLLAVNGAGMSVPGVRVLNNAMLTANYPGHMENFKMLAGIKPLLGLGPRFRLLLSSPSLVAKAFQRANVIEPMLVKADFSCLLSGEKEVDLSNLKYFQGPSLVIGAALGMGERILENADMLESSDVESHILRSTGHGDILSASRHIVEDPDTGKGKLEEGNLTIKLLGNWLSTKF